MKMQIKIRRILELNRCLASSPRCPRSPSLMPMRKCETAAGVRRRPPEARKMDSSVQDLTQRRSDLRTYTTCVGCWGLSGCVHGGLLAVDL
jgi:hypothetical protein